MLPHCEMFCLPGEFLFRGSHGIPRQKCCSILCRSVLLGGLSFLCVDCLKTRRMFQVPSFAFQMPELPPGIVTTKNPTHFQMPPPPPRPATLQVPPLVGKNLRTGLYEKCIQAIGMQLFSPGIFFFFLDREFSLLLVMQEITI